MIEGYVQFIAQKFQHVETKDPQLNSAGNKDFILQRTFVRWKKADTAHNWVKPIPIQVIWRIDGLTKKIQSNAKF